MPWGDTLSFRDGILNDPNYLKVIVPSCDGTLFQGNSLNGITYKGKTLYFRANTIVKSTFALIGKKYSILGFTNVQLAGSGLAASAPFIWGRVFENMFGKPIRLLSDSPLINVKSFVTNQSKV